MPVVLTLSHVRKAYGEVVAVDDLSIAVEPGEIFGLLGPNGAGKTTTIAMAVGLLEPDRGTVEIGERGAPTAAEVRRDIGVAPQALALYEDLTASENLRFFGQMQGLSGVELDSRVDSSLSFVGLSEVADRRVKTFSGGMQRRLNLAAAIVHEPELILLDEPTVGVDPQSRNALFDNVEELRERGRTILYTTHYMEEAQRLCDRIAIIDHGRLAGIDTVDGLLAAHGGGGTLVLEHDDGEERISTDDPLRALAQIRDRGGRRPESFRFEAPSLETVFLNLTGRELRD